jgi:nicotinamide mononucleotide transporter
MSSVLTQTLEYFYSLPLAELGAVFSSLLYVVLAAKGNLWCWPAAFISTILYTAIFYDVYLWMDSLLQIYYMAMAIYGWLCWRKSQQSTAQFNAGALTSGAFVVQKWSRQRHAKTCLALTLISIVLGWLMATYTPTDFAYFDAATTVFAVFATYLVAKKVLENWIYWVVIDFASIYIYVQKDLTPTAVLFALYVVIAMYGYLQWQKMYKLQRAI